MRFVPSIKEYPPFILYKVSIELRMYKAGVQPIKYILYVAGIFTDE